ncbi:hypothetical protein P9112_007656 [Eukaryota sp. TZLM1-RC]
MTNSSQMSPSTQGTVQPKCSSWNSGGYHWEERPQFTWAQAKLKELLRNIPFSNITDATFGTTEVSSVTGDASTYTRKQKVRYYFELEIRVGCKYEQKVEDDLKSASGEFILKIASDEEPEEWSFVFKPVGKSKLTATMKKLSDSVKPAILDKINDFMTELSVR